MIVMVVVTRLITVFSNMFRTTTSSFLCRCHQQYKIEAYIRPVLFLRVSLLFYVYYITYSKTLVSLSRLL